MIEDVIIRLQYRLSRIGVLAPWATALPGVNTQPLRVKCARGTSTVPNQASNDVKDARVFFSDNLNLSLTQITPVLHRSTRSCRDLINHCVNQDVQTHFEQSLRTEFRKDTVSSPPNTHRASISPPNGAARQNANLDTKAEHVSGSGVTDWTRRRAELLQFYERPFPGFISSYSRHDSVRVADAEYSPVDSTNRLVFWTDGSIVESRVDRQEYRSGIGIVWKMNQSIEVWEERSYSLLGRYCSNNMELLAVSEALKIAVQLCRIAATQPDSQDAQRVSCITVYTDSRFVIQVLSNPPLSDPWKHASSLDMAKLKECAYKLKDMGIDVEVRWVKGHAGVEGNVRADYIAHRAAKAYRDRAVDYRGIGCCKSRESFRTRFATLGRISSRPTSLINSQRAAFNARHSQMEVDQYRFKLLLKEGIQKRYEIQKKTMGKKVVSRFKSLLALSDPATGPKMQLICIQDR